MAALNLLAAIVIYWNTARLGEAVAERQHAGSPVPLELLAHTSTLGWARILLTGEYKWPKKRSRETQQSDSWCQEKFLRLVSKKPLHFLDCSASLTSN